MSSSESVYVTPQFSGKCEFHGLSRVYAEVEKYAASEAVIPHFFPDFFRMKVGCVEHFGCTDSWIA